MYAKTSICHSQRVYHLLPPPICIDSLSLSLQQRKVISQEPIHTKHNQNQKLDTVWHLHSLAGLLIRMLRHVLAGLHALLHTAASIAHGPLGLFLRGLAGLLALVSHVLDVSLGL